MARLDPLFEDAARLIVIHQQGSTSLIQRKFSIGYNRAGRIMDQMEKAGIVGPTQGSKQGDVMRREEGRGGKESEEEWRRGGEEGEKKKEGGDRRKRRKEQEK